VGDYVNRLQAALLNYLAGIDLNGVIFLTASGSHFLVESGKIGEYSGARLFLIVTLF